MKPHPIRETSTPSGKVETRWFRRIGHPYVLLPTYEVSWFRARAKAAMAFGVDVCQVEEVKR